MTFEPDAAYFSAVAANRRDKSDIGPCWAVAISCLQLELWKLERWKWWTRHRSRHERLNMYSLPASYGKRGLNMAAMGLICVSLNFSGLYLLLATQSGTSRKCSQSGYLITNGFEIFSSRIHLNPSVNESLSFLSPFYTYPIFYWGS